MARNVIVNVHDVGHAPEGTYPVYLTVYTKSIIEKTKFDTFSHQICPDDFTAECYTPITFKISDKVKKGTALEACVKNPFTEFEDCKDGKIKGKKTTIDVALPLD